MALSTVASKAALAYRPKFAPTSSPLGDPQDCLSVLGLGSLRQALSAVSNSPFCNRLANTPDSTASISTLAPMRANCACSSTPNFLRVPLDAGSRMSNANGRPLRTRTVRPAFHRHPSESSVRAAAVVSNAMGTMVVSAIDSARVTGPSATRPRESSAFCTMATRSMASDSAIRIALSLNDAAAPRDARWLKTR